MPCSSHGRVLLPPTPSPRQDQQEPGPGLLTHQQDPQPENVYSLLEDEYFVQN